MSPTLVIGTVHPDYIDAQYTRCLVETLADDRGLFPFRGRVLMERAPAGMLHVARNNVVRAFLAHPLRPDYLLFIDTDMVWMPEQIGQLLESAVRHNLCAVNALVCMQGGIDVEQRIPVMYDYDMRPIAPVDPIQRVFCAGSAFLLLRREELEACGQMYGSPAPWFDYQHRNGRTVTEEVIFSQRYHDLGFQIHVNTEILVGHRKIHPFYMPERVTNQPNPTRSCSYEGQPRGTGPSRERPDVLGATQPTGGTDAAAGTSSDTRQAGVFGRVRSEEVGLWRPAHTAPRASGTDGNAGLNP